MYIDEDALTVNEANIDLEEALCADEYVAEKRGMTSVEPA